MIFPDTNVLIHAVNADSPRHEHFREWWDASLSGSTPVCLAWAVVLAYVRITTNPRIMSHPLSTDEACSDVASWLSQGCVRIVSPLDGHWQLVHALLREAGTAGNLTSDAHLAALAMQHGCTLYSTDTDFARFPGLSWKQP
jgi:uncharacterized protein